MNLPPYKHKAKNCPMCSYNCGTRMLWITEHEPEHRQLKFWNEDKNCWEIDGFQCLQDPCPGLHNDLAIYKQRKEYMEAIIKKNKEEEEKQKFARQLLGGPRQLSMPLI